MDGLLVAGFVISGVLAGGLAVFLLVAEAKRRQREGQAVTVAELLKDARQHGEPLRLNWSPDQLDAFGRVRPSAHDDLPTGVFPTVPAVNDSNDRYRYKQQ